MPSLPGAGSACPIPIAADRRPLGRQPLPRALPNASMAYKAPCGNVVSGYWVVSNGNDPISWFAQADRLYLARP